MPGPWEDYKDAAGPWTEYQEPQKEAPQESGLDYLLKKAGMSAGELQDQALSGFLQRQGHPAATFLGKAARFVSEEGPTAIPGILGTLAGGPGLGIAAAAAGRSLQNVGQSIANVRNPGSAAQKSPLQQAIEPPMAAASQAAFEGLSKVGGKAVQKIGPKVMRGLAGVKEDIGQQALKKLSTLSLAPSVKAAGEEIGKEAEKAGILTGEAGLKKMTGMLEDIGKYYGPGHEYAKLGIKETNLFSDSVATDLVENGNVMKILTDPNTPLNPRQRLQVAFSARQAITNALQAPKFNFPPGEAGVKLAMNRRTYMETLGQLDDIISKDAPVMLPALGKYRGALVKEALSSIMPQNFNKTASRLGTVAAAGLGLDAERRMASGKSPAADLVLLAMMSPLTYGLGIRGAYRAGQTMIPQLMGRSMAAKGGQSLAESLSK